MIQTIGATLAVILGTLTLVGLAVRFILVPYLRENVFKPLQRTEHAVTANGHRDPKNPTVRDQFADLLAEVRGLRVEQAELRSKVDEVDEKVDAVDGKTSRIGMQLDAHLMVAATTDAATNVRLKALEAER